MQCRYEAEEQRQLRVWSAKRSSQSVLRADSPAKKLDVSPACFGPLQ